MTGSDMIHLAAAMVILALTHIFCLSAMTERKYSAGKTALIYVVFGVLSIGLTLVVFALFGRNDFNRESKSTMSNYA